jgi:uncharacterized protein (UPF0261 family)
VKECRRKPGKTLTVPTELWSAPFHKHDHNSKRHYVNENLERRLLCREQVAALLNIPEEDLAWLINTRQLLELRIRGHQRFDSRDVYQLIETYKATQRRNTQSDQ